MHCFLIELPRRKGAFMLVVLCTGETFGVDSIVGMILYQVAW